MYKILPCSNWFFSGYSGFPLSLKTNTPNSNSIWNARTRFNEFIRTPKCSVGNQVTIYIKFTKISTIGKLTVFFSTTSDRFTDISISFDSRGKHCDRVVGVLIKFCQSCFICWSIHHLGLFTATRKRCVLNCVTQYNAILISCGNITPLNQNTDRTCDVSLDIRWRSIWCC